MASDLGTAQSERHRKNTQITLTKALSGQGVFVALVIITIFLSLTAPRFFTSGNLINVLRQTCETAIGAAGQAVVILVAGIDLSVGSILSLAGVTAAVLGTTSRLFASVGLPWELALICALVAGALVGYVNGLLITRFKITPIITTLASMTAVRGLVYIWTNAMPIYRGLPDAFATIGRGYVGPIPIPVIIMFGLYALFYVVLKKTVFGRSLYAIGGNAEASRLSGVPVKKYTEMAYVISGICAAIAGIVVLGRLNSAQPVAGTGYELDTITAVVLGGVSLTGGRGSIIKVLIGSLIIGMLGNGLVLLNVSSYMQMVIKGLVLAAAVAFDNLTAAKERQA